MEKMTKNQIETVYNSIRFIDKINIVDGCIYRISDPFVKKDFHSLKDAFSYAIKKYYRSEKWRYITISIINQNISNSLGDGDIICGKPILETIKLSSALAYEREILIPSSFEEIYSESYDYADGTEVSIDYRIVFSDQPLLQSGMTYVSDYVNHSLGIRTLNYGKKDTLVQNPIVIRKSDNEKIVRQVAGSLLVGYIFFPQINYENGIVEDWDDSIPKIIPIASIRKYIAKRPLFEDFKRYKVRLKAINPIYERSKNFDWIVYIDHRKSDPDRLKNIAKLSIDALCNWGENLVPARIEEIPDGEWVWEEE